MTPSRPACRHQDDDCRHDPAFAERRSDGSDEMYERTFNEWMNLLSSWTRARRIAAYLHLTPTDDIEAQQAKYSSLRRSVSITVKIRQDDRRSGLRVLV